MIAIGTHRTVVQNRTLATMFSLINSTAEKWVRGDIQMLVNAINVLFTNVY